MESLADKIYSHIDRSGYIEEVEVWGVHKENKEAVFKLILPVTERDELVLLSLVLGACYELIEMSSLGVIMPKHVVNNDIISRNSLITIVMVEGIVETNEWVMQPNIGWMESMTRDIDVPQEILDSLTDKVRTLSDPVMKLVKRLLIEEKVINHH